MPRLRYRVRAFIALLLVLHLVAVRTAAPTAAADLPLAGDDTFQIGPVTLNDPTTLTIGIDRAYGPLADDAGHLRAGLIGGSVAAQSDLIIAPADGQQPTFAVAINQIAISGVWQAARSGNGTYRLAVPTTALLFPQPGDAERALAPRANSVTLTGASGSLRWLRLTVPGAPPVLLMAGVDLSCDWPGATETAGTWNDWGRWLTQDGVPYAAPARDGRLGILEQVGAIDNGYAAIRRAYGPDRPGLAPRVTLVGYSMGGLVARAWMTRNPGIVTQFITLATPNAGAEAATNFFAIFAARCAAAALRDLSPAVAPAFNAVTDLSTYWYPEPPTLHVTSFAAVPAIGERTDGTVSEESALALPYAAHFTYVQDASAGGLSLHTRVPHIEKIYTDARDWTRFAAPLRDARTLT